MLQKLKNLTSNYGLPSRVSSVESMNNAEARYKFRNMLRLRQLLRDNFVMDVTVISGVSVLHVKLPTLVQADPYKGEFHIIDKLHKDTLHSIVLRRWDHSKPLKVEAKEHELTNDTMTMTKVFIETTAFCSIELMLVAHERAFAAYEDSLMAKARDEIEGHFLMREAFGPF